MEHQFGILLLRDFILKVQSDQVALEKQAIQAVRDVGVAFGENQQPTNISWINMD